MANTNFPGLYFSNTTGTNLQYFQMSINFQNLKKILNGVNLPPEVLKLRYKLNVADSFKICTHNSTT